MESVLYVYAVTRGAVTPAVEGIDGSKRFGTASSGGAHAVFTAVPRDEFTQEVIDQRAGDLEWVGAIGYRHQAVVADLMRQSAVVPLRAFTLFSSEEALRQYLLENEPLLLRLLDRLDGKVEWTLQVEFEPAAWSAALVSHVPALRTLRDEIASAAPGKAFLLNKKLEEERKRASRQAEIEVVSEIEREVLARLTCETVSETRERRDGAFPQINVLVNRDEEAVVQQLRSELNERYAADGVSLALSGPWPPYSFAAG